MVYSNAGIPGPVVLRGGSERFVFEANGPFVGIFESASYADERFQLERQDRLLIFTDGVFEAVGGKDIDFGYNRLLEFIDACRSDTLDHIVEMVYQRSLEKENRRPIWDDVTIMGIMFD